MKKRANRLKLLWQVISVQVLLIFLMEIDPLPKRRKNTTIHHAKEATEIVIQVNEDNCISPPYDEYKIRQC